MRRRLPIGFARSAAVVVMLLAFAESATAQEKPDGGAVTIGQLLKSGWEVAGFASNADNRSTFILFRNPGQNYLVQCLVGYDVTREPRVFENCYRLK
jgi:hypothetical protein